jgi:hypothetical protein
MISITIPQEWFLNLNKYLEKTMTIEQRMQMQDELHEGVQALLSDPAQEGVYHFMEQDAEAPTRELYVHYTDDEALAARIEPDGEWAVSLFPELVFLADEERETGRYFDSTFVTILADGSFCWQFIGEDGSLANGNDAEPAEGFEPAQLLALDSLLTAVRTIAAARL